MEICGGTPGYRFIINMASSLFVAPQRLWVSEHLHLFVFNCEIDPRFDKISKIPYLLFDKQVLSLSKDVYTFDEATKSLVSSQPLLQDPYEKQMVYVAPSTLPGAGMGAFSKRPGKKGIIVRYVCIYTFVCLCPKL